MRKTRSIQINPIFNPSAIQSRLFLEWIRDRLRRAVASERLDL